MTVFRKFEVCASYEHLWLNRHLRQAANRHHQKTHVLKTHILSLYVIILLISCQDAPRYYPPKSPEMTAATYDHYKVMLDSAYINNDHFEAAIQLANLLAPSDIIFKQLDKGIRANPHNCFRVYEWYKLFDENNFMVNLVRADTTRYLAAYTLCIELLGKQAFTDFQNEKEEKSRAEEERRTQLDSSKFDPVLIQLLEQIEKDDQAVRIKLSDKHLSKADEAKLQKEMLLTDSMNLVKVAAILSEYGYPKKEKVGYELASTVWLVLHHQGDIKVRDKYQPIIEANASPGQIKAYTRRSEAIRLDNKIH